MSNEKVKNYFDLVANKYQDKNYGNNNKFLHFFFTQRLKFSTENIDFNNKSILDIGAGTGALFNYFDSNFKQYNYFATDISANMIANIEISDSHKFVGNCYDNNFSCLNYDYVYMLGVISYINIEELAKIFNYINRVVTQNSTVIVTINNKPSTHYYIGKIVKPIMKLTGIKNKLISQNIESTYFSTKDANDFFKSQNMVIEKIVPLNQTLYPFNILFPKISVKLGNFLERRLPNNRFKRFLSSDLILILKQQS